VATDVQSSVGAGGSRPEPGDGVRYVTRQPILDLHSKVHAYELLFSGGPEAAFRGDGEMAARTLLDSTVLFGLEKLTCGMPGFVKCTAEMLAGTLVEMLPPAMTVLEIVDPADVSLELMSACRNLKAAGYRLALDQSKWAPQANLPVGPLVAMADYLKVDFSRTNPRDRQALRGQVRDAKATMVAEKVET
jgi:c-di-GMP-related signal transduction protein